MSLPTRPVVSLKLMTAPPILRFVFAATWLYVLNAGLL